MRTREPGRRAEPSSTASTLSSRAISGSASEVRLYFMVDVCEITRSGFRRPRALINASVMPSAKYAWAESRDRLAGRSTTSDRMRSAVVSLAHSFGSLAHWHQHLRLVVTDGAFRRDGSFVTQGAHDAAVLAEAWRRTVLALFVSATTVRTRGGGRRVSRGRSVRRRALGGCRA